jgi:hypothetical protein
LHFAVLIGGADSGVDSDFHAMIHVDKMTLLCQYKDKLDVIRQEKNKVNNPQTWQAIAAIVAAYAALFGGLYAIVTRPIQSQLTDIIQRLGRIETKLDDHAERITRLEERTSPLRR